MEKRKVNKNYNKKLQNSSSEKHQGRREETCWISVVSVVSIRRNRYIYIYIYTSNWGQHVTVCWLRPRRFAPLLTPVSSICSPSALPCSLDAPLCSPSALPCSLDARSCSPSATSFFRPRRFLASLSETLGAAESTSRCWSYDFIHSSVGCLYSFLPFFFFRSFRLQCIEYSLFYLTDFIVLLISIPFIFWLVFYVNLVSNNKTEKNRCAILWRYGNALSGPRLQWLLNWVALADGSACGGNCRDISELPGNDYRAPFQIVAASHRERQRLVHSYICRVYWMQSYCSSYW